LALKPILLCDTDILVDVLRGFVPTKDELHNRRIEGQYSLCISVVSQLELMQGNRSKKDMATLDKLLILFNILHLNEDIGINALNLLRLVGSKSGMGVADALVASTALKYDCALYTRNIKHYNNIKSLRLYVPSVAPKT
jgi:predicted nucleic acid-binding protein